MRWSFRWVGVLGVVVLALVLQGGEPANKAAEAPRKVVIPFDFESKFDNGEYGQNIGEMFWTKLRRQGGFILPESMQDVRDWCQRAGMVPGPDTPLTRMKKV